MSVERAFGMLCRKWLLMKRPFKDIERTADSAGVHITVMVAMKLHNMAIRDGAVDGYLHETDVTGEYDTEEGRAEGAVRTDAHRRAQALSTSTTHLSGPNEDLARVELAADPSDARGFADAARGAAWSTDDDVSGRVAATRGGDLTCSSRYEATKVLRTLKMTRPTAVHWR